MVDVRGVVHAPSSGRSARDGFRALSITPNGAIFSADYLHQLAREGRIFYGSDADFDDAVLGTTTLANTTPLLHLQVPDATIAIPLGLELSQSGTVAGAEITVIIEIDNADRYSSGGTTETVLSSRTDNPVSNACTLRSVPTLAAGYGVGLFHARFPQDVSPVVADDPFWYIFRWSPPVPTYLVGPASWQVYANAATTAPTYQWMFVWAEVPESELN